MSTVDVYTKVRVELEDEDADTDIVGWVYRLRI